MGEVDDSKGKEKEMPMPDAKKAKSNKMGSRTACPLPLERASRPDQKLSGGECFCGREDSDRGGVFCS